MIAASLVAALTMPFPAQDEAELEKLMKQVSDASGRIGKSTDLSETAKDAELISKLLKESSAFWLKHSKDDATKWSNEGSTGAKELATAAASGNKEAVATASKTGSSPKSVIASEAV